MDERLKKIHEIFDLSIRLGRTGGYKIPLYMTYSGDAIEITFTDSESDLECVQTVYRVPIVPKDSPSKKRYHHAMGKAGRYDKCESLSSELCTADDALNRLRSVCKEWGALNE